MYVVHAPGRDYTCVRVDHNHAEGGTVAPCLACYPVLSAEEENQVSGLTASLLGKKILPEPSFRSRLLPGGGPFMSDHTREILTHLFEFWVENLTQPDLQALAASVERHEAQLTELEIHMSATDDMVARLATATDDVAADLHALALEVANGDATVAAKFEPLVSRLEALGHENDTPPAAPADVPPTA